MQHTIVLQLNSSKDLYFIIDLAKRLQINYFEIDTEQFSLSNTRKENASFLFEDLDIPQKATSFQLDNLPITQDDSYTLNRYNSMGFFSALEEVGGKWEEEEESLEEILELLK